MATLASAILDGHAGEKWSNSIEPAKSIEILRLLGFDTSIYLHADTDSITLVWPDVSPGIIVTAWECESLMPSTLKKVIQDRRAAVLDRIWQGKA